MRTLNGRRTHRARESGHGKMVAPALWQPVASIAQGASERPVAACGQIGEAGAERQQTSNLRRRRQTRSSEEAGVDHGTTSHMKSGESGTVTQVRTHSGRFTDLDRDKLRGGYYTSPELAAWLSSWAIRSAKDRVLEPSCGDGTFLDAAVGRLKTVGLEASGAADQILGIEILDVEAAKARQRLVSRYGTQASETVETEDFFAWWMRTEQPSFDAVIGNPPFIRYQSFPEPHRGRAMEIMKLLGLAPNRLTNIWVPFVAAVTASLRDGGRLALVLPAELLQVSYAAQLRSFLTDRFRRIHLVSCNELFFTNAEQEVILLLADGARQSARESTCQVTLTEAATVAEIVDRPVAEVLSGASPKAIKHDSEKWLKYFLTNAQIGLMRALRASDETTTLKTFADVNVGVVTGRNQFFVLRRSEADRLGILDQTVALVSRSVHLKGARIDVAEWRRLAKADERVHLLDLEPLNGSKLTPELDVYIEQGERMKVHQGYKCSIRTPWYAVPAVWTPDAFVFRQIYDFPRIVLNSAGATATDTIHRMKCRASPEQTVANTYTCLTAASAEIGGRSYGGGVLELEPTEATNLLMPAELCDAMPVDECDKLIRQDRLTDVLHHNDSAVLRAQVGLSLSECAQLRAIWERMRNRRLSRRRRSS